MCLRSHLSGLLMLACLGLMVGCPPEEPDGGDNDGLVSVPNVVGLPLAQAQAALVKGRLQTGRVDYFYSESVESGLVLTQGPTGGTRVAPESVVNLTVSLGPEPQGPISIETIGELQKIGQDPSYPLDGDYVLGNDIDASATATWNGGLGFKPIAPDNDADTKNYQGDTFSGTFDGQGYVISNLVITRPDEDYVGLFGAIHNALVTDVHLDRCSVAGRDNVGGLVGANGCVAEVAYWRGGGDITWSSVKGEVSGGLAVGHLVGSTVAIQRDETIGYCFTKGRASGSKYVGGLIGWSSMHISQCRADVDVSGQRMVGGLIGSQSYSGSISDCHATGSARGDYSIGGLVGELNTQQLARCYSVGKVSGPVNVGGLIGMSSESASYSSFWDMDSADFRRSQGGEGLSTASMMLQSTFADAGWDFSTVWNITDGATYPWLQALGQTVLD